MKKIIATVILVAQGSMFANAIENATNILKREVSPSAFENISIPMPAAAAKVAKIYAVKSGESLLATFQDAMFGTPDDRITGFHSEVDGEFLILTKILNPMLSQATQISQGYANSSKTLIYKCKDQSCTEMSTFSKPDVLTPSSIRLLSDGNFVMISGAAAIVKFFRTDHVVP